MDKLRKRKTQNPCTVCYMHRERCICHLIPKLNLKTKLTLVVHHRELKRTTNTGRLAVHALVNSEMYIRGEGRDPLDLSHLLTDDYESYILYPSDDAVDIESIQPKKPVQLIVSDGISCSDNDLWALTNANGSGGANAWNDILAQGGVNQPPIGSWPAVYSPEVNTLFLVEQSNSSNPPNIWQLANANGFDSTNTPTTPDRRAITVHFNGTAANGIA